MRAAHASSSSELILPTKLFSMNLRGVRPAVTVQCMCPEAGEPGRVERSPCYTRDGWRCQA